MTIKAFLLQVPEPEPGLVDADRLGVQVFPDGPAVAEALEHLSAAAAEDAVGVAKLFAVATIHRYSLLYTPGGRK